MEVHHHPHVGHGKKKFKEYLLEFLMIFLAVTMGFFAEGLREHITEKKKEKGYIRGFVADLKKDTAKLSIVLDYYDKILPMLDSGRKNFSHLQQKGSLRAVSQIQFSLSGYQDFIYTDATLQQVKSAGGLALIENKPAVDSILLYDANVKAALINETVLGDLLISMQHEMGGLLNMQPVLEGIGRTTDMAQKRRIADSLNKSMPDFLLTHDASVTGRFYNDYSYYHTVAMLVRTLMSALKNKAAGTINFLQKEYKLTETE
jgi:hypothetical protein